MMSLSLARHGRRGLQASLDGFQTLDDGTVEGGVAPDFDATEGSGTELRDDLLVHLSIADIRDVVKVDPHAGLRFTQGGTQIADETATIVVPGAVPDVVKVALFLNGVRARGRRPFVDNLSRQ